MWVFLMRRPDSPLSRALRVVVICAVVLVVVLALGLSAGQSLAAAASLGVLDMLLSLARQRPPEKAPSSRDAT